MKKEKAVIAGWTLKVLIFLFMGVFSARGKFVDWEGKQEMFDKMGFSMDLMTQIGFIEIFVVLIYLMPGRLGIIGAVLVSSYLGGAVVTHMRVGDAFIFPIILSIIAWSAILLTNKDFKNIMIKGGKNE